MKYESTILKRLIDTYGVVGNPRYISEIIKEFIVRGKERFPELFTYQADWLAHIDEFGLNPSYTVSYTGQSIYAPNTLERPVKSAILKGQTLVNLVNDIKIGNANVSTGRPTTLKTGFTTNLSISGSNELTIFLKNITPDVARYIILEFDSNDVKISTMSWSYLDDEFINYTTKSNCARLTLSVVNDDKTITTQTIDEIKETYKPMVLSGNHSYIPYFEGMQSVKLPVLTTSNEDGTKTNILTVDEPVELRGIGDVRDELDLLTGEVTERIGEIVLDGSESYSVSISNETEILFMCNDVIGYKNGVIIGMRPSKIQSLSLSNSSGKILIKTLKSEIGNATELKRYLTENNMAVQYQLETESIKTVDLTIHDKDHQKVERLTTFEGGTHFTTSSQDGSLLPTLSVDVVTDLEKTLMVCSLEGNTM